MKLIPFFIVLATVLAAGLAEEDKCSCTMPTSIRESFDSETTPVFKASVVKTLDVPNDAYTWTVFDVKVVFRGCAPSANRIVVKTPRTAGNCGVSFTAPYVYLLTVRKSGSATPPPSVAAYGLDVYSAVSCNYNVLWSEVPYDDQVFLYYSPVKGCRA